MEINVEKEDINELKSNEIYKLDKDFMVMFHIILLRD